MLDLGAFPVDPEPLDPEVVDPLEVGDGAPGPRRRAAEPRRLGAAERRARAPRARRHRHRGHGVETEQVDWEERLFDMLALRGNFTG